MGLGTKTTSAVGFLFVILIFALPLAIRAQWQGPTTVLALTEGDGPNQVGIGHEEINIGNDASNICVDDQGNIVIADTLHARILIFGPDGSVKKTIPKPSMAGPSPFWPGMMIVHPSAQRILILGQSECVYDYDGNFHKCFPKPFGPHGSASLYAVPNGFILAQFSDTTHDYWAVDLEGNMLGKLPGRPLELGRFVKENGKKYLKFPNTVIPAEAIQWKPDAQLLPDGNVLISEYELFNADGVQIGTFKGPKNVFPKIVSGDYAAAEFGDYIEYNGPTTDAKGNIYFTQLKYTRYAPSNDIPYAHDGPALYTILKWTYVGPSGAAAAKKASGSPETAGKKQHSAAPSGSKVVAKPATSVKPETKAAPGSVKKPAEKKSQTTAKPPAGEKTKSTQPSKTK